VRINLNGGGVSSNPRGTNPKVGLGGGRKSLEGEMVTKEGNHIVSSRILALKGRGD